ncbi:MAG TPA: ABC transporter ATP-binding protein [Clostridiales bacterium]|jgi:zinc transport system ATP-binding protein|nr:ABC transporter ATP-binding protein [Clostridiales bacterium]
MALITCRDLTLSYDGNVVISQLSFQVNSGDYLCIVGENGSGKSTLLKAILSLKSPDRGEIRFHEGLKQEEIGYLPQQTEAQKDFPANVWEVVLSGCLNSKRLCPCYSKEDRARARANMEKLEIADLARACFRELSGGQQRRVLLARALCAAKRLLLLDEPFAGLDPVITHDLHGIVKELNDEGSTIIMVSHDLSGAIAHASHILHLQKGPLFFGTVSDYLQSSPGMRFLGEA